jgi:hypothetical protein
MRKMASCYICGRFNQGVLIPVKIDHGLINVYGKEGTQTKHICLDCTRRISKIGGEYNSKIITKEDKKGIRDIQKRIKKIEKKLKI